MEHQLSIIKELSEHTWSFITKYYNIAPNGLNVLCISTVSSDLDRLISKHHTFHTTLTRSSSNFDLIILMIPIVDGNYLRLFSEMYSHLNDNGKVILVISDSDWNRFMSKLEPHLMQFSTNNQHYHLYRDYGIKCYEKKTMLLEGSALQWQALNRLANMIETHFTPV